MSKPYFVKAKTSGTWHIIYPGENRPLCGTRAALDDMSGTFNIPGSSSDNYHLCFNCKWARKEDHEQPRTARPHSQPCEHDLIEGDEGFRYYKGTIAAPIWQCEHPDCPGGKKIVLQEEAPLHVWTAYLNGKPFQVWSMREEKKR